ncbi:MAG: cupin domain-containing protein [Chloroflexota bacterium]
MFIRHYTKVPGVKHQPTNPGVSLRTVISTADGAANFVMRVAQVAPGSSSALHRHDYEHEVFILSGKGALVQGKKRSPLKAGDVVYLAPNEEHAFAGTGERPLRLICCIPVCEASAHETGGCMVQG